MSEIVVLTPYGIEGGVGDRYPPVQAFTAELRRLGEDRPVTVHHARSLARTAEFLRGLPEAPELVYCCGSSVMEVAAEVLGPSGAKIVYWGSHIEDGACVVNPKPASERIWGVELPMPLYHSHRQFRLLRRLFPKLERVHCMFSIESAFVRGERRARYEEARAGGASWIPSSSRLAAFPGLGKLGELIDVEVLEHPCADADTAAAAASEVTPASPRDASEARACVISCIDCLHVEGALERVADVAHARSVPFVGLNFGAFYERGPLLSFESDLEGAGRLCARTAFDVLFGGAPPERLARHEEYLLRVHPSAASRWGAAWAGLVSSRDHGWLERSLGPLIAAAS